ncbi:MAG: diphosphate--fructose-6-phosphate 1-phosphotransferase [Phycisphaerales bacterium]|nr:MAG: diphosphate--fructose-6-phosphate 1-phosphotransferase [Phycisphaerales bacterium]
MRTGNAVVGTAGGPTVVINQSVLGVIQETEKSMHIAHLFGARRGVEGIVDREYFDLLRQPDNMLDLVAQTPAAALGSTRVRPDEDYCYRILEELKRLDIRYFFYVGGNDSARTSRIISRVAEDAKYELRIIHIPKTIDNDLLVSDHTPGYGSCAKFVASAFIGDNLDNRALPGVKINLLMGRNAGFITAASILARFRDDDGPHLVYVPERPFDLDRFVEDVEAVYTRLGRCLVAVSEGIHDGQGKLWAERVSVLRQEHIERDAFGNLQLGMGTGSLADFLAGTLRHRCKNIHRVRADVAGYLQRSYPGSVSIVDSWEARLCGQMAVSYSVDATANGSVALLRLPGSRYAVGTKLVDLKAVAPDDPPFVKTLPDKYISAEGNNVTNNFREYVRPLIGDLPRIGWFEQIAELAKFDAT